MARYEVLSDDAMATIERGWRRLLQDIGVAFNHPEALRLFREAGQIVEDEVVRLDPDFVLDLVAKAPRRSRCAVATLTAASRSAATP